jgi:phage/plasmid-like protein (TIGR03299 family)
MKMSSAMQQALAQVRAANRGRIGTPIWETNTDFKKIDGADSTAAAIDTAELNWTVEKEKILLADGTEVPDKFALVRRQVVDDKPVVNVYGLVGPVYKPVQNHEKFAWFDPYLQTGKVKIVSAGSVNNGEKVVVVAKLEYPDAEVVPGDTIAKYIILSDTFDGKHASKLNMMAFRLVCANGATRKDTVLNARYRHNRNTLDRMGEARLQIDAIDADFAKVIEEYRTLARKQIKSETELRGYLMNVFEFEPKENAETKVVELPTRSQNILDELVRKHDRQKEILAAAIGSFENANDTVTPAIRGSYYAAYNAVTEYLNHERGHNRNNRMDSLLFGEASRIGNRALEIALQQSA